MSPRPDFFVVGAPRCGTTSLYRYLRDHPQIFMPWPKEPQFFAADSLAQSGMRYPEDLERYLALFAGAGNAIRIGEASTTYFESPDAPPRIREFEPGARIIVMLRNPIDMIQSLHGMRVAKGLESVADFALALEDEQGRPGFGIVGDQSSIRYRDRALFGEMLPRWYEAFGPDRVHIIILEDMATDPAAAFRGVLGFLEVDQAYAPASFGRHNPGQGSRSAVLTRVGTGLSHRRVPLSIGDRIGYPVFRLLRRLNRRKTSRSSIPPELRRRLEEEFAPDVERLGALLGRDLGSVWFPTRTVAVTSRAGARP